MMPSAVPDGVRHAVLVSGSSAYEKPATGSMMVIETRPFGPSSSRRVRPSPSR